MGRAHPRGRGPGSCRQPDLLQIIDFLFCGHPQSDSPEKPPWLCLSGLCPFRLSHQEELNETSPPAPGLPIPPAHKQTRVTQLVPGPARCIPTPAEVTFQTRSRLCLRSPSLISGDEMCVELLLRLCLPGGQGRAVLQSLLTNHARAPHPSCFPGSLPGSSSSSLQNNRVEMTEGPCRVSPKAVMSRGCCHPCLGHQPCPLSPAPSPAFAWPCGCLIPGLHLF